MNENIQNFWEKIKEVYNRMELRQRLMIAILLAITFTLIILMITWSMKAPEYELLFGNLSPSDAQRTREILREANIKHEFRNNNRDVYVPPDKVYETRLTLATEDIGQTQTGVGYELFDRVSLGTTERVQEINYLRARQGELEKTIVSINGVESARVHLVDPRDRLFVQDQKEPTASVRLTTSRRLDERQIVGITKLIANAVEGLEEHRITIVDQTGRELSLHQDDSFAGIADRQLRQQVQRETQLVERIQFALDRVLGAGNSYVILSAELNFDQRQSTATIYDPEGQVVLSEQIQSHTETNLRDSLAITNEEIIANYVISQTEQTTVSQVGDIKRLTVAAYVNHQRTRRREDGVLIEEFVQRTEQQMADLQETISTAVGFNAERGDEISVRQFLFEGSDMDQYDRLSLEKEAQMEQYISIGKNAAVIIILLVLIFVLNSQFKKIFATPEQELEEEATETLRPAFAEGGMDEGFYPEGEEGMPMGDGKISFTFKPMRDIEIEQTEAMLLQETIQKFVVENPEVTVKLIKSWLMDERPPGKRQQ